jgi:hypothetical protein
MGVLNFFLCVYIGPSAKYISVSPNLLVEKSL